MTGCWLAQIWRGQSGDLAARPIWPNLVASYLANLAGGPIWPIWRGCQSGATLRRLSGPGRRSTTSPAFRTLTTSKRHMLPGARALQDHLSPPNRLHSLSSHSGNPQRWTTRCPCCRRGKKPASLPDRPPRSLCSSPAYSCKYRSCCRPWWSPRGRRIRPPWSTNRSRSTTAPGTNCGRSCTSPRHWGRTRTKAFPGTGPTRRRWCRTKPAYSPRLLAG